MSYCVSDVLVQCIGYLAKSLTLLSEELLEYASSCDSQDETYPGYMKNSLSFSIGSFICQKFLYGHLKIDEFFEEMIKEDLKIFLMHLPDVPSELVEKYGTCPTTVCDDNIMDLDNNGDKDFASTQVVADFQ